jgi:uncharacterized delta-60 repeat protein
VHTIALQADGKIIIGGDFTAYNGIDRNHIARLNADGSLDTAFNPGAGTDEPVSTIALQADGKIIIGEMFTTYNGASRNGIARLNADGSLDTAFNPSAGADEPVSTIVVQANGKIIIGGHFSTYNGIARNRIVRLNADGSLDMTFNPGVGANGNLWTTVVQADGKIIIGGPFTTYNGIARSRIARLNADGSLDTTFNPGRGAYGLIGQTTDVGIVQTTAVQANGKIIIGGDFTTYNVTARSNIARLNADGSLDTAFNVGIGANGDVSNITVQADGKIIIGGIFTTYNGSPRNGLARLNTDGSLDTTFNPGAGADGVVSTIVVQADGKIIIGGMFFTNNNGTARNYLMRLNADGSLDTTFNVDGRRRFRQNHQ